MNGLAIADNGRGRLNRRSQRAGLGRNGFELSGQNWGQHVAAASRSVRTLDPHRPGGKNAAGGFHRGDYWNAGLRLSAARQWGRRAATDWNASNLRIVTPHREGVFLTPLGPASIAHPETFR